jgi:hypothetical protein
LRPPISIETTPGASCTTRSTRSPWRRDRATGTMTRKPTIAASVAAYSAHQYARATGWRWNSWPVASWWLKASATAT